MDMITPMLQLCELATDHGTSSEWTGGTGLLTQGSRQSSSLSTPPNQPRFGHGPPDPVVPPQATATAGAHVAASLGKPLQPHATVSVNSTDGEVPSSSFTADHRRSSSPHLRHAHVQSGRVEDHLQDYLVSSILICRCLSVQYLSSLFMSSGCCSMLNFTLDLIWY